MKIKYLLFNIFTVSGLAAVSAAAAAAGVYTCEINGQTVYTSRPSGNCRAPDLPAIGRYSSSRYDAPESVAPQASAGQKETRSGTKTGRANAKADTAKAKTPAAPIRQTTTSAAPPAAAYTPKTPSNNSRRSILETELGNERKALSDAQKSLAQARAAKGGAIDHQQIKNLESSVLDRQQNIQALQRELGRM